MLGTVDVHSSLQEAILLHQSGQFKQAATIYQRVLDIEPANANALHLLGLVFHQSGQPESAIILIKQALDISPNQLNFLHNLANILRALGQFEEAVQVYRQVIQLQPDTAATYNNLGISLHKLNQFQPAAQAYRDAIELNPEYDQAYSNLAATLIKLKRLDEAIGVCLKALEISSDNFTIYCNLGNIYKEQEEFEEAIQSYQQAISIQPNVAEVHSNMGQILEKTGMPNKAISEYQKALDINPEHAGIRKNLGVVFLALGSFKRGWEEYEWRWKCDEFVKENKRDFPQPMWDNRPLDGKSIAIWLEQGVGDCIMFASVLGKLQQQAEQILVETEYRLLPIFQRSFPGIDFFLVQNPSHPRLLDSSVDYQSSIGSLARWLLPDEESFPKNPSYLKACADRTGELRGEYQNLAPDKLLIGISWRSVNEDMGKLKSTSLIQWTGLLSQNDCFFINLQYGDVGEEIGAFTGQTGISIYQDKGINSLESLDDFSAQVSALDLVISTSNTTVHMAGALGKPVWTLLHYVSGWRWQLDRSDTPWYPSMKLYRQPSLGDWDSVFQQVQPNLEKFVEQNLRIRAGIHA